VNKNEFTYIFSCAYKASFTPETIKAAFRVTGIHPFCCRVITEFQMKPSLTTSVKGTFPLPQPSPVCAVMAAMSVNPPTALAISPSTHIRHQPFGMDSPISTTPPSTPSLQRSASCLEADPALFTPSKCIQTLYAAILSTSSGSCLVAKAKLTSATPITAPVLKTLPPLPQSDWSLAKQTPAHQTN
ncbi:hypothetical protein BDQ12DRAFT_608594, partial [Crucibulum laeve]